MSVPPAMVLIMTEMLAALLGAIGGDVLSAWVGSRQTAKVLKHETELAATERREAQRADEDRRRSLAANQLIAALADFVTVNRDDGYRSAAFVRVLATEDVHRERNRRAAVLLLAGSTHAHALPTEVRERWDALTWMVRFNQSKQEERSEALRRRDASDLLNYIEYVRRSLCAVSEGDPMPPHFAAPDVRREEPRIWGYKPEGQNEPDLSEWQLSDRLIGKVTFTTGEVRWYGPNGLVLDLPPESAVTDSPAEWEVVSPSRPPVRCRGRSHACHAAHARGARPSGCRSMLAAGPGSARPRQLAAPPR